MSSEPAYRGNPIPADLLEQRITEAKASQIGKSVRHAGAAAALARLLLERGETNQALALLDRFEGDFVADGLAARARLAAADPEPELVDAFAAWDRGEHEDALEELQERISEEVEEERRDLLRRVMVAIFTELGADHPLARAHRRRLALALN